MKSFNLVLLVFFIPFLWLVAYNHPSADDFPITHTARDWGTYTTVVGYYKCWSSRYTSLFLMSVNPLVFGSLWGYKLVTPLLFLGFILGFYRVYNTVFLPERKVSAFGLAVLSCLVYLVSVPSLAEGFFYLGGALFYQPGHLILLFLTAFLFGSPPPSSFREILRPSGLFRAGLGSGLLVLLAGCNEVTLVFALAMGGILFIFPVMRYKKIHTGYALMLISVILAAVVILLSPATFYRMEASGSFGRGFREVALSALIASGKSLTGFLSVPSFTLLLVLVSVLPLQPHLPRLQALEKAFLVTGSICLYIFLFVPSFLGEGMLQARTENSIQFLLLYLVLINRLFLRVDNQNPGTWAAVGIWRNYLYFAIVVCIPLAPNFRLAVRDLISGEARAYSSQRDDRIRRMQQTPGDSVWVPAVTVRPKSIFYGEIGDFPDPWYDNHGAALYGKKFVHLEDSLHPAGPSPQFGP